MAGASSILGKLEKQPVAEAGSQLFEKLDLKKPTRTDISKVPEGTEIDTRMTDIQKEERFAQAKVNQETIKNAKENVRLLAEVNKPVERNLFTETDPTVDPTITQDPNIPKTAQTIDADILIKRADKKRDLALKINQIQKEKELTSILQAKLPDQSTYDVLRNTIGKTAGAGNAFSNIESRATAIYTRVSSNMFNVKDNLRTKWAGLAQDTEMGKELVRFLKDGKVQNKKLEGAVKQMATEWTAAANQIKNLRIKAGGKVGELEDWVVPQSHNNIAIKKAGKDEWISSIRPLLDVERIEAQVGKPISEVLDNAYVNITSPDIGVRSFTSNVAKRHEESRVLHFKDGDSIIKYNERFGSKDVFATMDNHVRMQSQEISTMQLFGANPDDNFLKLKELAKKDGMSTFQEHKLDALWGISTGKADGDAIVGKADQIIATIGGAHRSIHVASKLGSATVSAIADIGNIVLGSGYRHLSSIKILGRSLQSMFQEAFSGTKSGRNVELASRLGIVSEFANASLSNSRFAEVTGTGGLAKTAEVVIRASGLGAWTDTIRSSFGLELNSLLYSNFKNSYDNLAFKNMLSEYGITKQDWDIIRTTKGRTLKSDSFSSDFLDMEALYNLDEGLGYKVSEMINTEMDAFVIMPTNRTQVWTTAGAKKGTLKGELARNVMLFKSFPIAVVQMHIARLHNMTGSGKVAYTVAGVMSSIVFGGLALMAYDLVTGKKPRDIERPEFLWESIMKGGGLGIFGDLFSLAENRYGHSWLGTFVGVPYSTGEDIAGILGDIKNEIKGDDTNVMANAYNRAKKYIPAQNLWMTRTLFSETLGDFVQEAIDPDFYEAQYKKQMRMKELGQESLFK